jgi:hypothetical protein
MTTTPLKPPKLSAFHRTVLEIVAGTKSEAEAIQYIQDWQNDKDSRCTRAAAQRYIAEAQQAARRIEELTQ